MTQPSVLGVKVWAVSISRANDSATVGRVYPSGMAGLDELLAGGLAVGDNVVWVADRVSEIAPFTRAFLGEPAPLLRSVHLSGVEFAADEADLRVFDTFPTAAALHDQLFDSGVGPGSRLVVWSLDDLVAHWGADEAVAFYTHTCPRLFERGAIAYWSATRSLCGAAVIDAVSRIAQCVFDLRAAHVRVRKAEGRPLPVQGAVAALEHDSGGVVSDKEHTSGRLGEGLRRLRSSRGLSQRQLAEVAGVTPAAISQAESGRRGLSLDTLVPMCERLEIGLDDLLGIGRPPSTRVARHDRNDTGDRSVTRLFDDVDDPARVHLVELAPGESGRPAHGHKGPEVILVAEGLVLVDLGESSPVLRAGDALSATEVHVRQWTNLSVGRSRLFWVAT